jgi:hypothetical protein
VVSYRVAGWDALGDPIYQVDPAGIQALRADLDRFWSRTLVAFKQAVESTTEESP